MRSQDAHAFVQYIVRVRRQPDLTWKITSFSLDHNCDDAATPDRMVRKRALSGPVVAEWFKSTPAGAAYTPVPSAFNGSALAATVLDATGLRIGRDVSRNMLSTLEGTDPARHVWEYHNLPAMFAQRTD